MSGRRAYQHHAVRVLFPNLADEQGTHARACATSQGVCHLEACMPTKAALYMLGTATERCVRPECAWAASMMTEQLWRGALEQCFGVPVRDCLFIVVARDNHSEHRGCVRVRSNAVEWAYLGGSRNSPPPSARHPRPSLSTRHPLCSGPWPSCCLRRSAECILIRLAG